MSAERAGREAVGTDRGSVRVREIPGSAGGFPSFHQRLWETRFPSLVAGITAATDPEGDFGLSTADSAWQLLERCERLAGGLGFPALAVARQVHGAHAFCVDDAPGGGVYLPGTGDALLCRRRGLLLGVTAADCVPVYLVDPRTRGIALLHAGWRGIVAGVLEEGVGALGRRYGSDPADFWMHAGPAICGDCYEVGPEVLVEFGVEEPDASTLDLRAELAARAARLGIRAERVSLSAWCTRCDLDHFHSHRGRGNRAGRMLAFLGWAEERGRTGTG